MGRVGVEKSPAVGSQLLNGHLACRRSQGNLLPGYDTAFFVLGLFQELNLGRALQRLHHTLGNEEERHDQ